MPNLYELLGNYEMLQRAMDDPEVDMDTLLDALDEAKGSVREKVDNICRLLASLDGEIAAYKREEARLEARRKARENKKEKLREWVRMTMDALDIERIQTTVHQVSLQKGSEKVVVGKLGDVPDEYFKVKKEVDKARVLREYRDDGVCVPGTQIVRGNKKLVIR